MKLWIYTNYDCNLRCSYCVAESSPKASQRGIEFSTVRRLVNEAVNLGCNNIYFTGGEPFILDGIFEMLAYSAECVPTTVLTNAMLLRGDRLAKLAAINCDRLTVQVSLDGSRPEHHDPYRGHGSWQRTVEGIRNLQQHKFKIRISTTQTPANQNHLDKLSEFCHSIGISNEDHIIRPLAKRGYSLDGMEVGKDNLIPELTVNTDGVYWHPLSTDEDMLICKDLFPLGQAVSRLKTEYEEIIKSTPELQEFQ